jgi:hypothetical protein
MGMRDFIWNNRGYVYTLGMCIVLFAGFMSGYAVLWGIGHLLSALPLWAQIVGGLTIGSIIGWRLG